MTPANIPSPSKSVIYLGACGFPYGYAEIQKIILISKSLVLTNNEVTVVSTKGTHNCKDYPDMQATGIFEGIHYLYTSGSPYRNDRFLKRNLLKIKGAFNEWLFLRKKAKANQLDVAIISTHRFILIVYYRILSRIYGFKIVLNYVEFFSKLKKKWYRFGARLNDILYDRYAPALSDGVLPISEFLIDHLKKVAPAKKFLKIPGLTDFDRYNNVDTIDNCEKYFLFCGAGAYMEIIKFIIDAYNLLPDSSVYLYLVINGNKKEMTEVKNYIANSHKKDYIKLLSKLPEKELFTYYKNAMALLIPLRPTFQDIARFPHKTGEYMASGNPVISTNYGEIKFYFRDNKDMLLADSYDVKLFADKMKFAIDNQEAIKQIGATGKIIASSLFDYKCKAKEIDNFLDQLS